MNDYSRKQDGDAKEHFSLIEWLTNEVKLPQYSGVFLEQGFKLPIDCFRIDEVALDLLKIEKIGHRKRILVSCQKLAARYGLTNDVMKSPQIADGGDKGKSSENDGVEMSDKTDAPPNLPPKKGKKLKPAPPPRKSALDDSVAIEQEVNGSGIQNEDVSTEKRTDILGHTNPSDTELKSFESDEQTTVETTNAAENVTKSESVDGLPSGSSVDGYERIWEASEGKPLAASPTEIIDESSNDKCFSEAEVNHKMSTDSGVIDNLQEPTGPPANQSAEPPPIPPRVDLDNTLDSVVASQPSLEKESVDEVLSYASSKSTVENTPLPLSEHVELKPEEKPTMRPKKIPPQKPPRRNKPISVGVQTAHKVEDQEQRNKSSLGSVEDAEPNDVIYENEVFITQNHMPVEEQVSVLKTEAPLTDSLHDPESITKGESLDEDNIYSNVEQSQRIPKVSSSSLDETKGFTKRPIPVPRTKSLSGMPISDLSESAPGIVYHILYVDNPLRCDCVV